MLFRILIVSFTTLMLTSCELALFSAGSGGVVLYWSAPQERVNGDVMDPTEIGGYEIRYRTEGSTSFKTIVITDPSTQQYNIDGIDVARTVFEVAVFDTDGIYSDFVRASDD